MPDYPKSNQDITKRSIKDLHKEIGGEANSINESSVSRGSIGANNITDSVFYCARNFSINERCGYESRIRKPVPFPETIFGPWWGVNPSGILTTETITEDDQHSSIWHRQERLRGGMHGYGGGDGWTSLKHSSSFLIVDLKETDIDAYEEITEDVDNTPDWTTDYSDISYTTFGNWRTEFGSRLFTIPNQGNGYHLLFHVDINLAHSLDNDTSLSPKEWKQWLGGQRIWTSVVYVLKPNKDSRRALVWSPGHMIGATGSVVPVGSATGATIEGKRKGQSNFAQLGITHSYNDVLKINNQFIRRMCRAHGYDFDTYNMELKDDSYFGWSVRGGLDRWDAVPKMEGLTDLVEDAIDGTLGLTPYTLGQEIHVSGGNVSFMAFKYIDVNKFTYEEQLPGDSSAMQFGNDPNTPE